MSAAPAMKVHYSSDRIDWETPQDLFDRLNERWHFTLDVCALPHNAKCARYFTPEDDGLAQSWDGEVCWMNPPYGDPEFPCKPKCTKKICVKRGHHNHEYRPGIIDFMRKAVHEASTGQCFVVCLVPARTDTAWWHQYAMLGDIEFLRGRLRFSGAKDQAPFPSAIVSFPADANPKRTAYDEGPCECAECEAKAKRNADLWRLARSAGK